MTSGTNLYIEISKLFSASHLNKDGTAPAGSGLSEERKAEMAGRVATDFKAERGWYGDIDYKFYYDWRLDPWYVADEFHAHIEKVKETTGADKVAIMAKCLGTNVVLAYVAKYGAQMIPTGTSANLVADQFASVKRASFGATTSTVYDTLSDEYIAARVAEGKGKYISPDKQIDASTCLFPDYTWFIKGNKHSNWSWWENDLIYTVVTSETQLSIDDFDFSQYVVYNKDTNFADKMTTENMNTEQWDADPEVDMPDSPKTYFSNAFQAILDWFKSLFKLIGDAIKAKIG